MYHHVKCGTGNGGSRAYPDIKAMLDQDEWETSFFIGLADPDLAIHQEPMMEVHDALLQTRRPVVHLDILFALFPGQAV